MPELKEEMYCSQQICIPPTFPYLLRQFAKAAIRTQPKDLLKWSTTYFRCLSLNIPPPIKPRLEYPIPKDFRGITPGWLKALLYQMSGSHTVTFKTLWDRWIGACLEHSNLIQILCIGGFEDNMAIPWIRFIGLCAAHLTENLTQTMILICEILTEEPEGGSATITIETFIDLYTFLARIDASFPQTLKNYYFLDKFLELYQEKIAKDSGIKEVEEEKEEEFSLVSSESTVETDRGKKGDDGSVISCPSVSSQDPDHYMKLLMKLRADGEEGEYTEEEIQNILKSQKGISPEIVEPHESKPKESDTESIISERREDDANVTFKKEPFEEFTDQLAEDKNVQIFSDNRGDVSSKDTEYSSPDKSVITEKDSADRLDTANFLKDDLEKLKANQELLGEADDDIEQFKAGIIQAQAEVHADTIENTTELDTSVSSKSEKLEETSEVPSQETEEPIREYEEVFVEAIPGIGAKVPEEIIALACEYMKEVSKLQGGLVMPRNIRHYEAPPLEVYHDRD